MAGVLCLSCGVVCFLTFLYCCEAMNVSPTFSSVKVINETYIIGLNNDSTIQFILAVNGQNLNKNMKVRVTTDKWGCSEDNYLFNDNKFNVTVVWSNSTNSIITATVKLKSVDLSDISFYTCVKSVHRTRKSEEKSRSVKEISTFDFSSDVLKWIHQGESAVFRTKRHHFLQERSADQQDQHKQKNTDSPQASAQQQEWTVMSTDKGSASASSPSQNQVLVYGFKLETSEQPAEVDDDGIPALRVGSAGVFRLFGTGWTEKTRFVLSKQGGKRGEVCQFPVQVEHKFTASDNSSGLLELKIPALEVAGSTYYLCTHEEGSDKWFHIGNEEYLQFKSYQKVLPLWLQILIIVCCLMFSSLFSGLNLGLMSLDRTDLRIICNTGTESEKDYAKTILPVREHGNYLLCSILLGNVMVNSTFTILLDDLTSGLVAVIASTLLIVVFGEITPQAVCSRHGLAIGAKTILITKVVMVLTFPLAYPISKILDWALGEEIGAVYTRERLKELVKLTTEYNDLEKDEVNIISGALELRKKTAADIMTSLDDAFMLSYDAILNFETVSEIMKSGFSRIPVYQGERSNIVTVLYIKDLALVDPDDNTPLKTLSQFYQNSCYFIFEDMTLDLLFKQLKDGTKGHMAFVQRVNSEGPGDPFYEAIGLVTLEDIIEELIQAEIMDETDVWMDRKKTNRTENQKHCIVKKDFTAFLERSENQRIHISPQLTLATFQFLSTLDPFKTENISETILSRLLKQDIIYQIKVKNREHDDKYLCVYQQGKAVDYFILILEGRVEVTMGRENLVFESGPFTYFGMQALTQTVGAGEPRLESPTAQATQTLGSLQSVHLDSMMRFSFVPDYTVRAVADTYYLRIKRQLYLAAKRATLMERCKKEESNVGDNFDEEVDKMLHTYEDDNRSQGSPDITRTQSQRGTPSHTSPNSVLNNGSLLTASEPALVSPSRTPRTNESLSPEERTNLLRSVET